MSNQQKPLRKWRITVIEWLSHNAFIEAETAAEAEAQARQLWTEDSEHQFFSFDDSGLDGVVVDEV